jgi:hydroxypyruvate isomerase
MTTARPRGRIRHSVSRWCYDQIPLAELARHCVRLGIESIELTGPGDWPVLKAHGLVCAMTPTHSIEVGFNRAENHPGCLAQVRKAIDATAEAGFPNVICFSGNRAGLPDDVGARNCVAGLKQLAGYAEQKNVTICIELLNSKVDHKDYQCDRTAWAVEVCRQVGSERVKMLYDIYHMQVMEGDVMETLRRNAQYIGHVHTGGVPGRHEIDGSQELHYPAIIRALAETGYEGYVGQEFVPTRDPIASLEEAIRICDL